MIEQGAAGGRPPGVLVVDSERAILELLTRILSPHGFKVVTADGVEAACAGYDACRDQIDLILLDTGLLAAGDALRRINPAVRVALMSGGVSRELFPAGFDAVWAFPKPFPDATELAARLRELL